MGCEGKAGQDLNVVGQEQGKAGQVQDGAGQEQPAAADFRQSYESCVRNLLSEHEQVFAKQDLEELSRFMEEIEKAERVFVVGAGREGIAARGFAMRLMHLGKETHWLWDDTTPGMRDGDFFLVIDGSGKIGHIDYLADQALKTGARVGVVTGAPAERIPQAAHCRLFVPACVYKGTDPRVVESTQPMGNLFEQHLFLLFDVMSMLLRERMGLTYGEMESRHRNIE